MSLGLRIYARWERFCKEHPQALEVAEAYGTKACTPVDGVRSEWQAELKRLLGTKGRPRVALRERWHYQSSLEWDLIGSWVDKAGDPDTDLGEWARDGVPRGINKPVTTRGIFPHKDEERGEDEYLRDALAQMSGGQILNYASIKENLEDAKGEVERLIGLGYAERVSEAQVKEHFSQGTVSKLGIVVKTKDDGTKKVRLVIDMRRSGGNAKATLPEKLELPRVWDAIEDLKASHRVHPWYPPAEALQKHWAREFVMVDIDGCLPTLEHCVTPDVGQEGYLLFKALLFGSKCAPLLWSRLAAWVARALQSCTPATQASSQVYLDDTLWLLTGTLEERNRMLAFALYTLAALGLKVSFGKGERGALVTWTGVRLHLKAPVKGVGPAVYLTLPEKLMALLVQALNSWAQKGMAPLRELRSVAGRVSWLSGVLPACRWTLSVFYAVMKERELEVSQGLEERRRRERRDQRPKDHLFVVKRLEQARVWLVEYLRVAKNRPTRRIQLGEEGRTPARRASGRSCFSTTRSTRPWRPQWTTWTPPICCSSWARRAAKARARPSPSWRACGCGRVSWSSAG